MQTEGYCHCGCGQKTPLAPKTRGELGWIKGQPLRFLRGHVNRVGVDDMARFTSFYIERDLGYATPCWVWQKHCSPNGYGMFQWRELGRGQRSQNAHRWRWEHEHGPVPVGLQLDHLCRVRGCVNPAHLEPVTPLENSRRSRLAKLTTGQAEDIYRRKLNGETTADIAALFSVSTTTVSVIAKNGPHGPRRPEQNARHRANRRRRSLGEGT